MYLSNDGKAFHIRIARGEAAKYVLLPGDPFRTDIIAQYLDDPHMIAHNREHKTWCGTLCGERVFVTSTGMGAPSAAIAVEELIECGARTIIRIGTAGRVCAKSLDPSLDGVISIGAVRDEGTTKQYVPAEFPAIADRGIVDALAAAAAEHKYNFIEGITQSKDAFYGEVEPDMLPGGEMLKARFEVWKKANVMASEMEASALFVVSAIRGARAGAIVAFEDVNKAIITAVDAVKALIINDRDIGEKNG